MPMKGRNCSQAGGLSAEAAASTGKRETVIRQIFRDGIDTIARARDHA
jgi:hypothetical protein